MVSVKELAKWLKEEVEFLKENQDYVGGWYELSNGLAATILWEEGWGEDPRDDVIQATDNPDWGLCAGIFVVNKFDTPDGWFMPWDSKTGDIICETVGISPNEDYEGLAQFLLDDYNLVKDCDIAKDGEVKCVEEPKKEDEVETEVEDEEDEIKEDFTEKGTQLVKRFNELGLGDFYEPFVGSCGPFTKNGYEEFKDKMNTICDEFDDFAIIKDFTNAYQDQDACDGKDKVIELDEEPIELYWVTSLLDGVEEEDFIRKPRVEESCKKEEKKKTIKESKEYSTSPYKDIIAEHFEYDGDFEFLDIIASIIGRIDDFTSDEDIWQAIDDELIYTYDQWKVLEHYCTPQDANWEDALDNLSGDIFAIASTISGGQEEDIEIEDEVEIEDED